MTLLGQQLSTGNTCGLRVGNSPCTG